MDGSSNAVTIGIQVGIGLLTLIVGALSTAFGLMWKKIGECQEEHRKCQSDRLEDQKSIVVLQTTVDLLRVQVAELTASDDAERKVIISMTDELRRLHPGFLEKPSDSTVLKKIDVILS